MTSSAPSAASNPVRRLILLRHGQTEYNADSRMQGQLDTDLSELGRTQAKSAGPVIADRRPLTIVSSDLRRAYFTAVAVGDAAGLPVLTDTRLRETHLGEWQGLTHHDVDERTPGVRSAWRADATLAPPGGESRIDVANRSLPVVHELLDTHPGLGRAARGSGGARRLDRGTDSGIARPTHRSLGRPRRIGKHQLGATQWTW